MCKVHHRGVVVDDVHVKAPGCCSRGAEDGGEIRGEDICFSIVRCDLRAISDQSFDLVPPESSSGVSMMEGCVCISLPYCPEFSSLLPVRCPLSNCHMQSISTSLPQEKFTCGQNTSFFLQI